MEISDTSHLTPAYGLYSNIPFNFSISAKFKKSGNLSRGLHKEMLEEILVKKQVIVVNEKLRKYHVIL